jgi:hypothetical protein
MARDRGDDPHGDIRMRSPALVRLAASAADMAR